MSDKKEKKTDDSGNCMIFAKHEVRDLRNGYFALFLKTGEPIFYLLAVNDTP